jgi:hypothetical protein
MFIRQVQKHDAIKMLHFFHKKLIKFAERWGDNLDLIDRKVGQWREVQTVWNPPSFSADEMTPFPTRPESKVPESIIFGTRELLENLKNKSRRVVNCNLIFSRYFRNGEKNGAVKFTISVLQKTRKWKNKLLKLTESTMSVMPRMRWTDREYDSTYPPCFRNSSF